MKIGVLTYHRSCNFGANLQAASTCAHLKSKGYEPVLIDYFPDGLKRFEPKNPSQIEAHFAFLKENFEITSRCKTSKDVAAELERLSISNVIIGSDAVFNVTPNITRIRPSRSRGIIFVNPPETTIFPNPFWGEFRDYTDCLSSVQVLSASSQDTRYYLFAPSTRRKMGMRLRAMDSVFVRDEWTRKMVSYLTENSVNPEISPDPVFAYNNNLKTPDIDEINSYFKIDVKKTVLLGFRVNRLPSKRWFDELVKIIKSEGLEPLWLPMPAKLNNTEYKIDYPIRADYWYSLIRNCRAYIGNNMHPIVISIHNSVPFFAFDQYGLRRILGKSDETSSKTYHILKKNDLLDFRTKAIPLDMDVPPPMSVWARIKEFDREKCAYKAQIQQKEFLDVMSRIEDKFE